jgi:hypothetical protein
VRARTGPCPRAIPTALWQHKGLPAAQCVSMISGSHRQRQWPVPTRPEPVLSDREWMPSCAVTTSAGSCRRLAATMRS